MGKRSLSNQNNSSLAEWGHFENFLHPKCQCNSFNITFTKGPKIHPSFMFNCPFKAAYPETMDVSEALSMSCQWC